MRFSVALATFNGAEFLREQLESINAQSVLPHELVVSDDCSTDGTIRVVTHFAVRAKFNVKIFRNTENLGYAKNFFTALAKCTGDIVFLSDQDDAWLPKKIETVATRFQQRPASQVVLNDMVMCDDHLQPSKYTQLGNILHSGGRPESFFSGCCMAIRRPFTKLLFPLPELLFAHDNWINHLALSLGVRDLIPDVLQMYRRHGGNASKWAMSDVGGASKWMLLKSAGLAPAYPGWLEQIERYKITKNRILSRVSTLEAINLSGRQDQASEFLDRRIQNLQSRIAACNRPRLRRPLALAQLWIDGAYNDFSGFSSLIKDLVRP